MVMVSRMSAQRATRFTPPEAATGEIVVGTGLAARFDEIRAELDVPEEFPPEVLAEAEQVAASPVDLPGDDLTEVPFLTIDPPGSMDLDQAMHLERDGDGYRVRYAIAYLPAFVTPGGAIDTESWERGQTIYAPDRRTPLHPPQVSEGPASLLPDQDTPAYVWDLRLDARGEVTQTGLAPAMVRSRDRLDYAGVQQAVDGGTDDERLLLLKEVGELRIALERERGGATLPMPEQEVDVREDGSYELRLRPLLPAEDWNAQISLMTGMAAAQLMLDAKVGILRTMPDPEQQVLEGFRRVVSGLGVDWPQEQSYGDFLRGLDGEDPTHLAIIHEATGLFRGAGYTAFDGELPQQQEQSAIGAAYAHVTAPLRRLVDRYGLAVCAAVAAGEELPAWAREALPRLPEVMSTSDRRAGGVERATTDAVECAALADEVGSEHDAVVVDVPEGDRGRLEVALTGKPVLAEAEGTGELGARVRVRVEEADIASSRLRLRIL